MSESYWILIKVRSDEQMTAAQFGEWTAGIRDVIEATAIPNHDEPWEVGSWYPPETKWTPQTNVWQYIDGVASVAMAHVWAAIHLVMPLEEAGFQIGEVSAGRTADLVLIA